MVHRGVGRGVVMIWPLFPGYVINLMCIGVKLLLYVVTLVCVCFGFLLYNLGVFKSWVNRLFIRTSSSVKLGLPPSEMMAKRHTIKYEKKKNFEIYAFEN